MIQLPNKKKKKKTSIQIDEKTENKTRHEFLHMQVIVAGIMSANHPGMVPRSPLRNRKRLCGREDVTLQRRMR